MKFDLRSVVFIPLKGFVLEEKKGDLFKDSAITDCMAHCVSVDLRMSKGIAVMFKKLYGGVDQLKKQSELSQHWTVP